jgi:hypothetical protein
LKLERTPHSQDRKSISLFIPLEANDYSAIVEYLQSECDAELTDSKTIPGGTQVKLTGSCGNQIVLKYFTKKANLQVQGKPLSLYEDLIEILSDLLPYEQFVNSQLKLIDVDIDPAIVKSELESRLPQSYDFIGKKVQAIISPSLALNKLNIELEDYTAIAMPVLRGLEGYIKQVFIKKGYTVDKNFGHVINGNHGHPCVINSVKVNINCPYTVSAIEKCYTYWIQQRHGLFHVDGNVETTRILALNDAQGIIDNTLELIETTYAAIPN